MTYEKDAEKEKRFHLLVKIISFLAFLLIWHLLVTGAESSPFLMQYRIHEIPAPFEAVQALVGNFLGRGIGSTYERGIGLNSLMSFIRVLVGFAIACVLGIPIGLAMGYLKYGVDAGGTIVEILRPIPPLAWIPIAIMIFRENAPLFIVFLGCFFPIVLNTTAGVKCVDMKLMEAAKTLGASSRHLVSKVVMPWALPSVVTGMRIGLGIGWMSVVAAEMVGVKRGLGIGAFIWRVYTSGNIDLVVAGMIMIGFIGWLMNFSIEFTERKLLKWRRTIGG